MGRDRTVTRRPQETFTLDKGIPLSKSRRGMHMAENSAIGKLAEVMGIGDSCFFLNESDADTLRSSLRYRKFNSFTRKWVQPDGTKGYRVWKGEKREDKGPKVPDKGSARPAITKGVKVS